MVVVLAQKCFRVACGGVHAGVPAEGGCTCLAARSQPLAEKKKRKIPYILYLQQYVIAFDMHLSVPFRIDGSGGLANMARTSASATTDTDRREEEYPPS